MKTFYLTSEQKAQQRKEFLKEFKSSPIPDNEILSNLGLYINRQKLSRILFMQELYKK